MISARVLAAAHGGTVLAKGSLSDREIGIAIDKIRKMYDDYIVTYVKPFTLKMAFEDRYFGALQRRVRLERFIAEELQVINDLFKREEERIAKEQERAFKKIGRRRTTGEYADQLIEQFRRQIEKYPDLFIDDKASFELRKLFGALDVFEREHWPRLDKVLRKLYPSYYNNPRVTLEPKVYALCSGAGHAPPRVLRYQSLLMRYPKTQKEIEWEEKSLILEAAFLLHQTSGVLKQVLPEVTEPEERQALEQVEEYVHALIDDFRLKDLKPTAQGA